MTTTDDYEEPLQTAIGARLKKLGSLPVDTLGLERSLRGKLPPPPRGRKHRSWAMMIAVAASVLIVAALAVLFLQGREAQASPVLMARMYHDVVDGRVPTMRANSLAEANNAIAAFSGNFPTLPEPPSSHMMACCMRNVGNKKVACILLDNAGTPVTMVVANAADMKSPRSPTLVKEGVTYHVQTTGDLHMVMTERDNRWICLISPLSQERLMDVAQGLHF
jgi:hypothetical protein